MLRVMKLQSVTKWSSQLMLPSNLTLTLIFLKFGQGHWFCYQGFASWLQWELTVRLAQDLSDRFHSSSVPISRAQKCNMKLGSTMGRLVPYFEYSLWPKRQAGFHMECVLWTEVPLARAALQTGSGRIVWFTCTDSEGRGVAITCLKQDKLWRDWKCRRYSLLFITWEIKLLKENCCFNDIKRRKQT